MVGGRWRAESEIVRGSALAQWNSAHVTGMSVSILESVPKTPPRAIKDEDVELPALPTPASPTMLPDETDATDELNI